MADDTVDVQLRLTRTIAAHIQRIKNETAIAVLEQWLRDQEMEPLFDLADEVKHGRTEA
jgi:hypothetical protein